MCDFGPKVDTTLSDQMTAEAAAARQREEERQGRITTGMADLDTQFGAFDDSFYDQRKDSFLGYYTPQIDDKFSDAKDQLTYALARAGTSNSTMAGDQLGKLLKAYSSEQAGILSQADADGANVKSRIGAEKSSLTAQLNATGDASRVSNDALGRTQQLFAETPVYSPLGDIFGGVANGIGNYAQAQREQQLYRTYFGNGQSGSSSRVIQ